MCGWLIWKPGIFSKHSATPNWGRHKVVTVTNFGNKNLSLIQYPRAIKEIMIKCSISAPSQFRSSQEAGCCHLLQTAILEAGTCWVLAGSKWHVAFSSWLKKYRPVPEQNNWDAVNPGYLFGWGWHCLIRKKFRKEIYNWGRGIRPRSDSTLKRLRSAMHNKAAGQRQFHWW